MKYFGFKEILGELPIGVLQKTFNDAVKTGQLDVAGELAILLRSRRVEVDVSDFLKSQMETRIIQLQEKKINPKKGFRRRKEIAVWEALLKEIGKSAPNNFKKFTSVQSDGSRSWNALGQIGIHFHK